MFPGGTAAAGAAKLKPRSRPPLFLDTGLVKGLFTFPRHTSKGDDGRGNVTLAEACSNVLEFAAVSRISGDPKYRLAAEKGLHAVHAANKQALLLERVDRQTGRELGVRRGLGPNADR